MQAAREGMLSALSDLLKRGIEKQALIPDSIFYHGLRLNEACEVSGWRFTQRQVRRHTVCRRCREGLQVGAETGDIATVRRASVVIPHNRPLSRGHAIELCVTSQRGAAYHPDVARSIPRSIDRGIGSSDRCTMALLWDEILCAKSGPILLAAWIWLMDRQQTPLVTQRTVHFR